MTIYTIGFTRRSARDFFAALKRASIRRVIDVRLHNRSQLAGFTKKEDLAFFLQAILGADYLEEPLLAPDPGAFGAYRQKRLSWAGYVEAYRRVLTERGVETTVPRKLFSVPAVLLCSERLPDHCHRRLAAEYLEFRWGDVNVVHL